MKDQYKGREVIIEVIPTGVGLRVSAMDVASLTEVVMPAPRSISEAMLRQNILKKLDYVLKKKGIIEA